MVLTAVVALVTGAAADNALPSWNNGKSKKAIIAFVTQVKVAGIPESERIAVFDNDGTLWSEQPIYFQLAFAVDRVKELASDHPKWKDKEPFKSVLSGDLKSALARGMQAILELIMLSHAENTTEIFAEYVRDWIKTAKHPKSGKTLYGDGLPANA